MIANIRELIATVPQSKIEVALDELTPREREVLSWLAAGKTDKDIAALPAKVDAGEFIVTVELDPPRGHNIEKLVQGAKLLKERGVEIVDINDGSLGRVRMSVLPTAMLIRDASGLDINMHFTCRDRNLMGIQGDLLGAHALDVRNALVIHEFLQVNDAAGSAFYQGNSNWMVRFYELKSLEEYRRWSAAITCPITAGVLASAGPRKKKV